MYDVLKVCLSSHLIIQKDFCFKLLRSPQFNTENAAPFLMYLTYVVLVFCIFCISAVLRLRCPAWAVSNCGRQELPSSFCARAPLKLPLLLWSTGSRVHGLQQPRLVHLAAPRHVRSSQTRGPTCVSCVGRWILSP